MEHPLTGLIEFAEWLLRSSWQATILAGLVVGTQKLVGERVSAAWKHRLWMLVLIRLALPVLPESPLSLFRFVPSTASPGTSMAGARGLTPLPLAADAPAFRTGSAAPGRARRIGVGRIDAPASPDRSKRPGGHEPSPPTSTAPKAISPLSTGIRIFLAGWVAGVIVLLGRLMVQNFRFARRIRQARVVDSPEILGVLKACETLMRLSQNPLLLETDAVQSPALYGWLKPRLLLPRGMAQSFAAEEMRFVFLHELAHIKRRDMPLNWLTTVLQTFHWFNPLLGFAFSQLRADRELAADSLALSHLRDGENLSYGNTILRILAELNEPAARPGLVGILEDKRQLTERLRMIARFENRPSSRLLVAAFTLLACMALTDAQVKVAPARPVLDEEPSGAPIVTDGVAKPAPESKPTKVLVQDGRLLMEMGKLDEAESKLREALRQDPDNRQARYYLHLVQEGMVQQPRNPAANGSAPSPALSRESTGRAKIYQKLTSIVLQNVSYNAVPLREVVQDLVKQARENDPEGIGVNMLIDPGPTASAKDLPTGDVPSIPEGTTEPSTGAVVIQLRLNNVLLIDVLDAITKVAEEPLRYQVISAGVMFSRPIASPKPFFTRVYHVNPRSLLEDLRNVKIERRPQDTRTNAVEVLRSVLAAAGVDFDRSSVTTVGNTDRGSGKALFFNEKTGVLLVRATMDELDKIEEVMQLLNAPPPQFSIEAELVELPEAAMNSTGLGWLLGSHGSTDNTNKVPVLGDVPVLGRLFRTDSTTNGAASARVAGNLTAPQSQTILASLAKRADVQVLISPKVTTLTGRATEINITGRDAIYRVWVIPYLNADGSSVQTSVDFSMERSSKEDRTQVAPNPSETESPLRVFTNAVLWDGQTVVLGPFPKPLAASEAGADTASDQSRRLLLFITPTLIDLAGNRVHPDTVDSK